MLELAIQALEEGMDIEDVLNEYELLSYEEEELFQYNRDNLL